LWPLSVHVPVYQYQFFFFDTIHCSHKTVFVLFAAAYGNTVVHVNWLASDDVTSRAQFTLSEGQLVEFNSSTRASCVYINSSEVVLVAQLNRLSKAGMLMSLVPALAECSSNYTFIAYRRQYNSDSELRHYIQIIVERSSVASIMMDSRRLTQNDSDLHWTDVCHTHGRLVSAELRVDQGAHRLYTLDARPFSALVFGYSNKSAYGASLASVSDPTQPCRISHYLWTEPVQTTMTSLTSAHLSTVDQNTQTMIVTMETRSVPVTQPADEEAMTSTLTSSAVNRSESSTTSSVNHTRLVKTDDVSKLFTTHVASRPAVDTSSVPSTTMETSASRKTSSADLAMNHWTSRPTQRRTDIEPTSHVTQYDDNVTLSNVTSYILSPTDISTTSITSTPYTSSSSSSSSRPVRNHSTTVSMSTIHHTADPRQTHNSNNSNHNHHNDDDGFELIMKVFIYGGVALICSLLVVWFLCCQTTLLKRHRVSVAANEHAISLSRDEAPVTESMSSGDCSMMLSESTTSCSGGSSSALSQSGDNDWVTRIAPLTPAYFRTPVGSSLDDSFLPGLDSGGNVKARVTRSVDVDLLRQLAPAADCDRDDSACNHKSSRAVNADKLYVESARHHYSQQNLHCVISLPQSHSSTGPSIH